jgi:hypothetical protein
MPTTTTIARGRTRATARRRTFGAVAAIVTLAGCASDDESGQTAKSNGAELPPGLQVSESGYALSPISAPASTGEAGTLSFRLLGPDGDPVTEYTESHEKDLHLIIVRTDTTEFQHVHPSIDADGTWSIEWEWETAGTYKVFTDFVPTGLDDGLTLSRIVEVGGEYTPAPPPEESSVFEADDYTVTLTGDLTAAETSPVTATIERDGQPVTDLEPYLGSYGHLIALRDGDLAYLHVHPASDAADEDTEPGPDVLFHVETLTPGPYRLFLDFQVDGQIHTADFTLTAHP